MDVILEQKQKKTDKQQNEQTLKRLLFSEFRISIKIIRFGNILKILGIKAVNSLKWLHKYQPLVTLSHMDEFEIDSRHIY